MSDGDAEAVYDRENVDGICGCSYRADQFVSDGFLCQRHDEASTGDQLDEAFAPECKKPLADRPRADSHGFGNPLDAEEIAHARRRK